MRILILGDLHLRYKNPVSRRDDYYQTLFDKLKYCLEVGKQNNCEVAIFPGDVFDSPNVPYLITNNFISLLRQYDYTYLAVFGQHDQRYHSNRTQNTPLYTVASSGLITILTNKPFSLTNDMIRKRYLFYGRSWGEDIPKPNKNDFNILVAHLMVIKSKKIWEGQEDFHYSRHLLRKYNYDLIVTGDNHNTFIDEYKGRILINCGSLARITTAQLEHKPICVVYDTENKDYKTFKVPIKPVEEVFNLDLVENRKKNKELEVFIESLPNSDSFDLDFVQNLLSYLRKNKVSSNIENIIKEVLEYARCSRETK